MKAIPETGSHPQLEIHEEDKDRLSMTMAMLDRRVSESTDRQESSAKNALKSLGVLM